MNSSSGFPVRKKSGGRLWASILVVLLLMFHNKIVSQVPGEMTVLETDNSFPGQWCCVNDGYLYGVGVNQRTNVLRKSENGQNYEMRGNVTVLNPNYRIENRIYSTYVPGLIFVLVKNETSNFFLLRSADGGMTFREVYKFGEGIGPGGTQAQDVRMLRGMLELTTELPGGGGVGTLFIGEYNFNKARIPGSVNDRVRIMKSVDRGETWTKVVEWNTNGSNQIGHIHAMKQDPYTGEIYICAGDYNSRIGILKWDGSSSWTDNRTLSQTGSTTGFRVFSGLQRYRTCDILFDENYFYTFVDTQTPNNTKGTESGIWRGRKDFSTYTRVDNQLFEYDPMHVGWFGEKIGNTFIFTTAREYVDPENAWKEINTQVYLSHDGVNWFATGMLNWRDIGDPTESRYMVNVFSYNNKLYLDCYAGAGHSSTIQCSLKRRWNLHEEPVILHPVFFAGMWNNAGNDNNPGTNADFPKRTLNNLLTNNRICSGARVRLSDGTFSEPQIYPLWSGANFKGRGKVVIEGRGMNLTHITRSAGSAGGYGISLEAARTNLNSSIPIEFKDLEFYITKDGGSHTNYLINNADTYVRTVNCKIGNQLNDDSPLVFLGNSGSKFISESSIITASPNYSEYKEIVKINADSTTIALKNCLVLNAYDAFRINFPATEFSLKYCTFYGIEDNGVTIGSNNNRQPFIKNNIFSCKAYPIDDQSGLTERDVDYNFYNRANRNVTDGNHGPDVGTLPWFTDPENGDFTLKSFSLCAIAGTLLEDVSYDLRGRQRSFPSSLGAYESTALIATPDGIIIDSGLGSAAEFLIRSNTEWQIANSDNWIKLSSSSGKGSGYVVISSTSSNKSLASRGTSLTISGTDAEPVIINVTQSADLLTADRDTQRLPLLVYPNPFNDVLNINYNDEDFKSFLIINASGLIVRNEKVQKGIQLIDLSSLAQGIYIIQFLSADGHTKKFRIIKI